MDSIKDPPLPMPPSRTGVAKAGPNEARKIFCSKHEVFHPSSETCVYCDVPKEPKASSGRFEPVKAEFLNVSIGYTRTKSLDGFSIGDRFNSDVGTGTVVSIEDRSKNKILGEGLWCVLDTHGNNTSQPDGAWRMHVQQYRMRKLP